MRPARTARMIPVLMVVCFCLFPVQAQYAGTRDPNDPYLIYTAEHLNALGAEPNDWNKHFKLMADIDHSCDRGVEINIIGY